MKRPHFKTLLSRPWARRLRLIGVYEPTRRIKRYRHRTGRVAANCAMRSTIAVGAVLPFDVFLIGFMMSVTASATKITNTHMLRGQERRIMSF